MNSHNVGVSTVKSFLVNTLYSLIALVSLLVGASGLALFYMTVFVGSGPDIFNRSGLSAFGYMIGLPLVLAGFTLLVFAVRLLFGTKYKGIKYKPTIWVSMLMGLLGISFLVYCASLSLRGL